MRSVPKASRRLQWMLLGLPFLLPLYVIRFKIGPLPTTFLEFAFGVFVVAYLIERRWSCFADGWEELGKWRRPLIGWIIATWFAAFVGPDILAGVGLWRAYVLEPVILFVILADMLRTAELRAAFQRSVLLSVVPIATWALIQFVTGYGIPHPWNVSITEGRRATGPFPFPNALALFATPIGAWAFIEWLLRPKPSVALVSWLASLLAIGCAKSDGGFLAFLIVAMLGLFIHSRGRKWAIGLVVIATIILAAVAPVRQKVWNVLTFHEWSGQVRLFIWRETWDMLKDRPILGAGLGAYPETFKPYHKATAIEIFQYPHNIILNLWSELGMLGLVAALWIGIVWVGCALQNQKEPLRRLAALAPLIVIFIHGLVDVPYFKNDLAMMFWMLLVLTVAPCPPLKEDPVSFRPPS